MKVTSALWGWGAALGCELVGARVLDGLGLIEGLLSPSGARLALLVPVAVAFFAARFIAWFVAPGLVLGALLASFRPRSRRRN